jgi:hypothetical protein
MSIVVGYLATVEGRAALTAATGEAVRRSEPLVVVVSERGDESDEHKAELAAALDEARGSLESRGIPHDVRVIAGGRDVAEDLIATAGRPARRSS